MAAVAAGNGGRMDAAGIPVEQRQRVRAAQLIAHESGYLLAIDRVDDAPPDLAWIAWAAPYGGSARFLAHSQTAADAAEAGLAVLRGVIERDEAWPDERR